LLALGFGCGLSPIAPGTVASLAAWAVWSLALPADRRLGLAALALFALLAWFAVRFALCRLDGRDPSPVVADEWLGMWCALALIPSDPVAEGAAFLLFRLLDVLKPGPIARLERLPGAAGVIADDLAAGLAAGGAVAAGAALLSSIQGA
jgi:phosphatidylglycerophosphatase A